MIIKIIPENDIEKQKIQEVEHSGVQEFFIFGNKKDKDEELLDFHDWNGSYRYLIGSLHYFTGLLSSEQSDASSQKGQETQINLKTLPKLPPQQDIPIDVNVETVEIVETVEASEEGGLFKKSGTQDGEIEGVVELKNQGQLKVIKGREEGEEGEDTEMEVEEEVEGDNSKGAED
jgi:hypothetical protein